MEIVSCKRDSIDRPPVNASSCGHELRLPAYRTKSPGICNTSNSGGNQNYRVLNVCSPAGRKTFLRISEVFAGTECQDHRKDGCQECEAQAKQNTVTESL